MQYLLITYNGKESGREYINIYMCVCVYILSVYIYIFCIFSSRFFPIIGYYKILSTVPCAIQ